MWRWGLEGTFALTDHLGQPITEAHGARRFAKKGQPLAGKYRMGFVAGKSDEKYQKETFLHRRGYDRTLCCKACKASKTDPACLASATGPGAPWRDTIVTTEQYMEEHVGDMPHLALVPGWQLELERGDLMHNLRARGIKARPFCVYQSWPASKPASQPVK